MTCRGWRRFSDGCGSRAGPCRPVRCTTSSCSVGISLSRSRWICTSCGRQAGYSSNRSLAFFLNRISGPNISLVRRIVTALRESTPLKPPASAPVEGFGGVRSGSCSPTTALISHESDFYIAKEKHLLPGEEDEVTWDAGGLLSSNSTRSNIHQKVDRRFVYGELRLSRLNKIYYLSQRSFLRGYMSHWHEYGTFFHDNFAWLVSATVYMAIVLTAMQVGLATNTLANNDAFQSVRTDSPSSRFWALSLQLHLSSLPFAICL